MKIKKRSEFPKCIQNFKRLKGICIGECIDKKQKIAFNGAGHAHCYDGDPHQGWICLKYKYLLKEKLILLHEVAHLIANIKYGKVLPHGKEWKAALVAIGGTFKAFQYNRRGRRANQTLDYTYRHRKR